MLRAHSVEPTAGQTDEDPRRPPHRLSPVKISAATLRRRQFLERSVALSGGGSCVAVAVRAAVPGFRGISSLAALSPTLLWVVSSGSGVDVGEFAEDLAGDVALEDAADLSGGSAFGLSALGVGLGVRVAAEPGARDDVERAVQLPVAVSVEAMPAGVAAGSRDWCGSGGGCERCLGAHPSGVGPGGEHDGGGEWTDARLIEEAWG